MSIELELFGLVFEVRLVWLSPWRGYSSSRIGRLGPLALYKWRSS